MAKGIGLKTINLSSWYHKNPVLSKQEYDGLEK
jgi:hypothetical protein